MNDCSRTLRTAVSVRSGQVHSLLGHIATDNRYALVVNVETTKATGTAERDAAAAMLGKIEVRGQHITELAPQN